MTATDVEADDLVERVLQDTGRVVRREMLDSIPDGEPHPWLYRVVRDYPSRPGKAIRPALCLATCRAFGGRDADVLPVAVAIEMLHNAFLSTTTSSTAASMRRGRPTLHAEHGLPTSPQRRRRARGARQPGAAAAPPARSTAASPIASYDEFDTMAFRTLEGQATELGWRRDNVLDAHPGGLPRPDHAQDVLVHDDPPDARRARSSARRAPSIRARSCGSGSTSARRSRSTTTSSTWWATRTLYGKEINGDLYEGKRTLMLIHLMREATGDDRTTVDTYLRADRAERTPEMVDDIRRLMDEYGSIDVRGASTRRASRVQRRTRSMRRSRPRWPVRTRRSCVRSSRTWSAERAELKL